MLTRKVEIRKDGGCRSAILLHFDFDLSGKLGAVFASNNSRKKEAESKQGRQRVSDLDGKLVDRASQGDDNAFIELLEQNKGMICKTVYRFVDSSADRDEVANQVIADMYFGLVGFRGDSSLQTWLKTIATRCCYRYLRQKGRERKRRAILEKLGAAQLTTSGDSAKDLARERVARLMNQLSADDRMVLTLLYWEECSVAEAAARMNWSESKIKVRAHRAKKRMKNLEGDPS